jgi:hypothetical protein
MPYAAAKDEGLLTEPVGLCGGTSFDRYTSQELIQLPTNSR